MTCYKFKCSHWWNIYLKENPLQDLLSSVNAAISTNERIEFIKGHMTYNLGLYLNLTDNNHPEWVKSRNSTKENGQVFF